MPIGCSSGKGVNDMSHPIRRAAAELVIAAVWLFGG